MTSNPFRRSSLREPKSAASASPSRPIPGQDGVRDVPFRIDLKGVNNHADKHAHVHFASPPAIPISPISYPSSPESNRISPELFASRPLVATPVLTDGRALNNDPFTISQVNDEDDDADMAIIQAVENAKANAALLAVASASAPTTPAGEMPPDLPFQAPAEPPKPKTKEELVRDTLSRFSSGPKRPAPVGRSATDGGQMQKSTMDVNAFAKMLLGGGGSTSSAPPVQFGTGSASQPTAANVVGEGGSIANMKPLSPTSSISESSSSSSSVDHEAERSRNQPGAKPPVSETRRKAPPIPQNRQERSVTESSVGPPPTTFPGDNTDKQGGIDIMLTTPDQTTTAMDDRTDGKGLSASPQSTPADAVKKRPPPPPITRRRTQRPSDITSDTRSLASATTKPAPAPSPAALAPIPKPAPPPLRRSSTNSDRRTSTTSQETESTSESDDDDDASESSSKPLPAPPPSSLRPPPPPTRTASSSTRSGLNPATSGATPPAPPPRRKRATSKASIDDSHDDSAQPSTAEDRQNVPEGGLSASATKDILADLAALQREVDALRAQR